MDVFDLYAKIALDKSEYEAGLKDAKGSMSNLAKGVGDGLKTVAKVGAAAVTAAATGVAALAKMSVEGYAEYEQLVGGVETLFKSSQNVVMKYAENAYKTAGMSANEYMSTVTSFSASLIQSLGGDTAKAAEIGDMAITDMSDNANKMGTSMEMIQNAYNGFAKQNYTMLDNLKLGYGGTKEEMQRLIDDANKVKEANGEMADLSIDSFADVAEAIHIIQSEMGITGTTAREAATTIEGSLSMMKGAWTNLVVGMADENANMEVLIGNFVESTATAAKNLLPRIEQILVGIGDLITRLAPVIADALPVLVEAVLPSLLTAAVSLVAALVNGIITALPALYDALLIGVQTILVEVFGVSEKKAGEFADSVNSFFVKIKDGFMALVESAQTDGTLLNRIWTGLQTAFKIIGEALAVAFKAVSDAFKWCAEQINTDGTWLNKTWTGIQNAVQALFDFVSAAFDAVSAAFKWCAEQINTDGTYLNMVWENIKAVAVAVWKYIQNLISTVTDIITNTITVFTSVLKGDWSAAWDAIKNIVSTCWNYIKNTISIVTDAIKNIINNTWDRIKHLTSNIWNGIKSTISSVWDGIKTAVSNAIDTVKSKISSGMDSAKNTVSGVLDGIKSKFSTIWGGCKKIVTDAVSALKKALDFNWSLPKLKLPHISVDGGEAPYGIGGKGHLPSFSISWYKKAYDNAMVLSSPTIFGFGGGSFLGGGDGNGNEIVAGESHLMNLIGQVVESKTAGQNEQIIALLSALLRAIMDGNEEMVRAIMTDKSFAVGEREFARLVKMYA